VSYATNCGIIASVLDPGDEFVLETAINVLCGMRSQTVVRVPV